MTKENDNNVQSQPTASENPLIAAINLQQEGKVAEAEALFRQILLVSPTNAAALYSLAGILLNANRPTEAFQLAHHGTEANPDFAPLWLAKGIAQRDRKSVV